MAKEVKKNNKKDKKDNKNFFKEFKAELKRVSWPTAKQLINNTMAVIAIVLLISAIVFVLDVVFKNVVTSGVKQLEAIVTSSSSETEETNTVIDAADSSSNEAEDTNVIAEETNTETTTENTTEEATEVSENQ